MERYEQAQRLGCLLDKAEYEKRLYCGTEDFVEFFYKVLELLDINSDSFEVEDVDGELEVVMKGEQE